MRMQPTPLARRVEASVILLVIVLVDRCTLSAADALAVREIKLNVRAFLKKRRMRDFNI